MVGVATSLAQVYSVNAVGYVNLTLRSDPAAASFGAIIANPLNGTNNQLNTVIPLSDDYAGTLIYRFDQTTQNYLDTIQFFGGFGWFSPTDPEPTVNPGEAFWIYPQGPNPLSITFVGDVPQGNLVNPLPPASKLAMRSSMVPQAAPIGNVGEAGTLEFAADNGDLLYIFDSATQQYKDTYQFFDGFGWFSPNPDDPGPQGPTIPVGTGFFLQKDPSATKTQWVRQFSVN
jgi:hypothetical protein